MTSREQERRKMRATRSKITLEAREEAGRQAAVLFSSSTLFQQVHHIACYFSIPAEFETKFIIEAIWKAGKISYLPLLSQEKPHQLYFARYSKETPLQNNHCGISEPLYQEDNFVSPKTFDLVIVPLLAFDRSGNRLGTGGGCYDRTFSFKNKLPKESKPLLCGLGFANQKVHHIKPESWDVKLDFILTELEFIYPSYFKMRNKFKNGT